MLKLHLYQYLGYYKDRKGKRNLERNSGQENREKTRGIQVWGMSFSLCPSSKEVRRVASWTQQHQ